MAEKSEYFFLREIFPDAGRELQGLLHGAAENALLMRSDFYTIRDWVEIARCPDQEELHAILLLMLVALDEGSLCIETAPEPLLRRLGDLTDADDAAAWSQRIPRWLSDKNAGAALIGTAPTDHKPVIRHTLGKREFLYFQKYLHAELDFHQALKARLQLPASEPATPWPVIVREVLAETPLRLDPDQHLALETALLQNLAVISGGPGTGKTSIVLTLLRCLLRGGVDPERIALAAPTGRAAQRLTDALRAGLQHLPATKTAGPEARLRDLTASTLHRLLEYRPSRHEFARHQENPIPADVVIVDEVSMVGLVLMGQLFNALGPETRLILLGDKDQLPSVEAGAVLANLVPDCATPSAERLRDGPLQDRVVLLRTNHRSQPHIRAAAEAINRQDAGLVERLPALSLAAPDCWQNLEKDGGCLLLEQSHGTANELRGFLQRWAEHAYFHSRLEGTTLAEAIGSIEFTEQALDEPKFQSRLALIFKLLDRYRLLTLVRNSAWGCVEINHFLEHVLRPRLDGDTRAGLFAGAPVLITCNDSARGLNNGDIGITLRHHRGGLCVLFERQDGYVAFPAEALPPHEPGFALTVHKSQGSEYAHVMLVLPPTGGKRLLRKELIYTAITRAKSLAVICSTKEVLKYAIERKMVRESAV
jgi:exodeoxyribonuclease V alpha subunit